MIEAAIRKVVERHDLSTAETEAAFSAILNGQASDAEIAALLTAMRMKGETIDELIGAARVMRSCVTPVRPNVAGLLDTCGTGGDGQSTFNISTATALVVAACGVPVAKHGNRGVSSRTGSADVLAALGVQIEVPVETVEQCIREAGVGFCFAPLLHPAMRHAAPVRRRIAIATIFNLLGPLTNPAGAEYQLLGARDADVAAKLSEVLARLGTRHAYVVSGADGLDEVTLADATLAVEVRDGQTRRHRWEPADFGLEPGCRTDWVVADATASAERIRAVLGGELGPARAIVLANAAAALCAADRADSLVNGVAMAAQAIDAGRAVDVLSRLIALTNARV